MLLHIGIGEVDDMLWPRSPSLCFVSVVANMPVGLELMSPSMYGPHRSTKQNCYHDNFDPINIMQHDASPPNIITFGHS